jgi:hypothetical protein
MQHEIALLYRLATQIADEDLRLQILAVLTTVQKQIDESEAAHRADLAMLEQLAKQLDDEAAKQAYAAAAPALDRNQQFRAFTLLASFRQGHGSGS